MRPLQNQENLVSIPQATADMKQQQPPHNQAVRSLQPKTTGARYPKTPLKAPLKDENPVREAGGKSILGNKTKLDRSQWVTPAGPRTGRAVLGDKTTNAKARNIQTVNGKNATATREVEKSQARPGRTRTLAPKPESSKLQILLDSSDPLSDVPDTTNAPPPAALPYVSDVFPDGLLKFDAIRPENRMKGYYGYYHNRRDENGRTRRDRELKAAQEKRFEEADARIMMDLEDMEWELACDSTPKKAAPMAVISQTADKQTVRTNGKVSSILNSRRAASALSTAAGKSSSSASQRRLLASKPTTSISSGPSRLPSFMQPTRAKQSFVTTLAHRPGAIPPVSATNAGVAASRSTLGYNKGRSASSVIQNARSKADGSARTPAGSTIAASGSSEGTVTQVNRAKQPARPKPEFVSIFEVPPEEDIISVDLYGFSEDVGIFEDDDPVSLLVAEGAEDDFERMSTYEYFTEN